MATRRQIVDCARTYLGTPFQHQGRIKGLSCDCIGLPICVARDLGVALPSSATRLDYPPFPADDSVLQNLKRILRERSKQDLQPGDILCLKQPVPCHVGIVTDLPPGLGLIHAYAPNDKVVEHCIDSYWLNAIEAVFYFPGVED